jgi:heme exporter protein B
MPYSMLYVLTLPRMQIKEIIALIHKEFTIEWRQKYAINGILLYLIGAIFICYLSFNVASGSLNPLTWNALFWIIILFSAINTVAKSFLAQSEGYFLYIYTLARAESVFLAKSIYNSLLLLFTGLIGLIVYSVILGNPVASGGQYVLVFIIAGIGLASTLTLVSGIAAKANNNITLMAVLSFPVILPILLMAISGTKVAMDGLGWEALSKPLLTLAAIDAIVITVALLLFPYLWRS